MPTIKVGGDTLHYYRHGAGGVPAPPLLLVHGAGGSLMHWPGQLRRLPGRTVYALDLPGHGGSGGAGRTQIAAYAAVVREFATALRLPPFVLGGHSMGGAIAIESALRYGELLAGLVLVATGARLPVSPQILSGLDEDFDATARLLTMWSHGGNIPPRLLELYLGRLRRVPPAVARGDFLACAAFDRAGDVARITLPTLIVCGEADRMTPPKYSRYLAEQIPGARLLMVPGAGHMALADPDAVSPITAAIARFLESLATGVGRTAPAGRPNLAQES